MNVPVARGGAPASMWAVLVIAVLVTVMVLFLPYPQHEEGLWGVFPLAVIAGVTALTFVLPKRLTYQLEPDALVLSYMTGQTRLPCQGMTAWRTQGRLGLRMGGTNLPGYHTGNYLFHADGLKNVLAAASDTRSGVIVQTGRRSYFLTPAEPDALLSELARRGAKVRA